MANRASRARGLVSFDLDERDDGVVHMIRQAVDGTHRTGRHIGICGLALSECPDFAPRSGLLRDDSMSLIPDTLMATEMVVATPSTVVAFDMSNAPPRASVDLGLDRAAKNPGYG